MLEAQFSGIQDVVTKETKIQDLETQIILIQTVNPRELQAAMSKLNKDCGVLEYKDDSHNPSRYYVGKWGDEKIPVVIIQTCMGGDGAHGSLAETKKALQVLPNLKYIFAVGVCAGIKGKVKLGDVVVSKVLQDCSNTRREDGGKLVITSPSWPLDEKPFFHFLNQAVNKPKIVKCGMVLSANNLIKDGVVRDQLVKERSQAIAIEMEGHGIARACQEYNTERKIERKIEYLVVKGVCDFADKYKSDEWQPQAAKNAVDALYEVMKKFEFGKSEV